MTAFQKICLLVLLGTTLQAQEVLFFNEDWDMVAAEEATYYRHVFERGADSLVHIQDFYKDGTMEMDAYVMTVKYDYITNIKYRDDFVGPAKSYYPNGQLKSIITFDRKHLRRQGPASWYLKDGTLLAQGTYDFGHASDGIVRNPNFAARFVKIKDGKVISRFNYYEDSHQIANEVFYYEDNFRVKEEVFYSLDNQLIGRMKYAEDGILKKEQGTQVDFYRTYDGKAKAIKTILHYVDGKAEGKQVSYHIDGTVWFEGVNQNDKHDDGRFIKEDEVLTVHKGVLEKVDTYDDDWRLVASLDYKEGQKWEGLELSIFIDDYYHKGKRRLRVEYFSGWKKYIKYQKYYGETVDTIHWFSRKGLELGMGTYNEDGIQDGLDVLYRVNTTRYATYKNGKKEGYLRLYEREGLLLSEKLYKQDTVLTDKTRHPVTGKMVACEYKNGKAWSGSFFEYERESVFKEGVLIMERFYKEVEGTMILDRVHHLDH